MLMVQAFDPMPASGAARQCPEMARSGLHAFGDSLLRRTTKVHRVLRLIISIGVSAAGDGCRDIADGADGPCKLASVEWQLVGDPHLLGQPA